MGEVNGDFDGRLTTAFTGGYDDGDDDERVHEWEIGLPNVDDITPLTQGLIPPELLSAFNIKPERYRTSGEVTQASEDTLSLLRGTNFKAFCDDDDESETKKQRRTDSPEDADSAAAEDGGSGGGDGGDGGGGGCEKAVKRARLVWTPQLHKRFVDVVAHLGIKNAVPKTIMQLMNVEGLTRENVASHLQKYRLYLKRMQGGSFDGGSNSSSENNGNGNGNGNNGNGVMSVPVMPMGMMGMGMMGYTGFESNYNHNHNHNHSHQQNNNNNNNNNGSHYSNGNSNHNHNNHHQMYSNGNNGMMMMQSGNKYGSVMSYHHSPHVGPSEN